MEKEVKRKVFYHANCNDGSGAALAAWLKFGDEETEYIPVSYNDKTPSRAEMVNKDIYVLDFSFSRKFLLECAELASSITVIDHHKTAQEALSEPFPEFDEEKEIELCSVETIFDMKQCGAALAWKYFHPEKKTPLLFEYLGIRDLWIKDDEEKFKMACQIKRALELYPDFRSWKDFRGGIGCYILREEGKVIERYLQHHIAEIAKKKPQFWERPNEKGPLFNPVDDSVRVPVHYVPSFMTSDVLAKALELHPESPYAVNLYVAPNGYVSGSLRSRQGSDVDVSEIAKRFGGGGHKHAAGF